MKRQNIIIGTFTAIFLAACAFIVINDQSNKKEARFNRLITSHMTLIETLISEEAFHKAKVEDIYTAHVKKMEQPVRDYKFACEMFYIECSAGKAANALSKFLEQRSAEYYAMCEEIDNEINHYRDSLDAEVKRAYEDYELYTLKPEGSFDKEQVIVKHESLMRKAEAVVDGLSFENFKKDYIDKFFDANDPLTIEKEALREVYAYL